MIRFGSCVIALQLAGACLAAPAFHAPTKGAAPFRRDRLPIDPDRMAMLSDRLTTLAAECGGRKSPEAWRASAQLLALARALKPTNRNIEKLSRQLKKGEAPKPPAEKQLSRALSGAWQHAAWLASSEAGSDAKLLAACLGDALAVADPNHPQSAALRDRGEHGKWAGWVADPESFGINPRPKPGPGTTDPPNTTDSKDPDPPEAVPSTGTIPLKLQQVRVLAPVHSYDKETKKNSFGIFSLQLDAGSGQSKESSNGNREKKPAAPLLPEYYIDFQSDSENTSLRGTFDAIRQNLIERHGGLPLRGRGKLSLADGGSYRWQANRDAAIAAVALMMDASLSGEAIANDVIVLGTIDSGGAMRPSWRTWERLRKMADDPELPGGRLILPRDAAPMLEALLVHGKPGFFIRYEVLLAGSLSELAERAAAEPAGGQATAAAEFAKLRKASKNEVIGPFLSNRFVRERLTATLSAFPDHASARLALLQGSGERPTRYATPILAAELRACIEPMSWIPRSRAYSAYSVDNITKTRKQCRELLDPIEDLVARKDQELWDSTYDLIQALRTFSNTVKRAHQDISQKSSQKSSQNNTAQAAAAKLSKRYSSLIERLNRLSGEDEEPKDKLIERKKTQ